MLELIPTSIEFNEQEYQKLEEIDKLRQQKQMQNDD